MKYLIINADDFGMSKIFNKSILKYLGKGFVSSTTVMVNRITAEQDEQVGELINLNNNKDISVGLHYEIEGGSIETEISLQYKKFVEIFGFKPSHIDRHKLQTKDFYQDFFSVCEKLGYKTRAKYDSQEGKTTDKAYFSGTGAEEGEIKDFLNNLEDNQSYEILFHPGNYDQKATTSLNKKRELDNQKIEYIHSIIGNYDIKLISFNTI